MQRTQLGTLLTILTTILIAIQTTMPRTWAQETQPPKITATEPLVTQDEKAEEETDETSFWMKQKIDLSKDILEALTQGDFEQLDATATKMQRLSKLEGFVRNANSEYRAQLKEFGKANASLISAAQKQDTLKSLQAFHGLTTSCVRCHQVIRQQQALPTPNKK